MRERRFFSSSERVALFLTADGRCESCGVELEPGWHADHERPFSRGGPTDVVNGSAKCRACNLKKGAKVTELRTWQVEALKKYHEHSTSDFLTVATPGAGKTTFALEAMKDKGGYCVVVVPTVRLRIQWHKAASRVGIELDPYFENSSGRPSRDFHGVVVTYAAVASQPDLYRRLISEHSRTFVVFDEIHHCGEHDKLAWGTAIRKAFALASHRLLLSGTPFRGDNNPIPFVRYQGEPPTSVPDYRYDYGRAFLDSVVRGLEFVRWDALCHWMTLDGQSSLRLEQATKEDEGRALASALEPDSEWVSTVLPEAHKRLMHLRRDIPDAANLVFANNQYHARQLAQRLSVIAKCEVPIAISDDPDAHRTIEEFARSTAPHLVAVNMVSEGVDIPRLMMGVYATNKSTETFFRQANGRLVRTRGVAETDSYLATMFVPSIPTLRDLASQIEEERAHVLSEAEDERETASEQSGERQHLFTALPATDGRFGGTIMGGDKYPADEIAYAEQLMQSIGVSPSAAFTATHLARILRVVVVADPVMPPSAQSQDTTLADEYRRLRKNVRILANKVIDRIYRDDPSRDWSDIAKTVWIHANKAAGEVKLDDATMASLQKRLDFLHGWLTEWKTPSEIHQNA